VKNKINVDTNGARTVFDRFRSSVPDSYFSTHKPQVRRPSYCRSNC